MLANAGFGMRNVLAMHIFDSKKNSIVGLNTALFGGVLERANAICGEVIKRSTLKRKRKY